MGDVPHVSLLSVDKVTLQKMRTYTKSRILRIAAVL